MKRLALAALFVAASASAQISDFQTTPVDTPAAASQEAVDAFGNVWMVDPANVVLGKIDPAGGYTPYSVPADEHAQLYNLATTPDGAVWYADYAHPIVGRLSPRGAFHRYTVASNPYFIAGAPDSGVFFSSLTNPKILGHLPAFGGEYTSFHLPDGAVVENLTVGPDGAAYFTDLRANKRIVRVQQDGTVQTFPDAAANPPQSFTWFPSITTGPDGNIWFTHATAIGRLRLKDGKVTEYPIPYAMADASGITAGGDGNVWFADSLAGAGVVSQLVLSTATDDGHATINASPGIGEPIGILAIPATASTAAAAAPIGPAPSCRMPRFVIELNIPLGPNLSLMTIGPPAKCADLQTDLIAFRAKDEHTVAMAIDVLNGGPDDADDPVLEFHLSGVTFISGNLPGYDCEALDGGYVECDRTGPLGSGQTDSGAFDLTLDQGVKAASVSGTVFSDTPDPTPYNGFSGDAATPEPKKIDPPPAPKAKRVSRKP